MGLREEETLSGNLEPYYEQGMEIHACIVYMPDRKESSIHWLEDGDLLTVFNDASKTDILWQGTISYESHVEMGLPQQKGVSAEKWHEMFWADKPAEVLPRKYVEEKKQQAREEEQANSIQRKQLVLDKRRAFRSYLKRSRE